MSTPTTEKDLERLTRLVALANQAGTPEEADTARKRALTLAARHNVDLAYAHARLHTEQNPTPTTRMLPIGRPRSAGVRDAVMLVHEVGKAHDCESFVWTSRDMVRVELIGFPDQLDIVVTLAESLLLQMSDEGDEYLRTRDRDETDVFGRRISGRSARKNFNTAFVDNVAVRLRAAQQEAMQAASVEHTNTENHGAELVRVERAQAVRDYAKRVGEEKGVRGSYSSTTSTRTSASATAAGALAGRNADLGGRATKRLPR